MTDYRTTELTAKQVREAIISADRWKKPMGNTGLTNTHLIIRDDGWQAIADELNAALGRQKAKAHPYGYEPDTGAFDATRCECGCLNDISATYCNNCGGEIEIDMNAEKEIYRYSPRNSVFATKHDDGSLEFGEKRYVAETLGGGKLIAEQVRKAVEGHGNIMDNRLYEDWQAVADELNAELGGEECEIDYERHCSNCGVYVHEDAVLVRKSLGNGTWTVVNKPVSYCPNCGKAVKR